jgi:hypothetical protein
MSAVSANRQRPETKDKHNLMHLGREEIVDWMVLKARMYVEHYRGPDSTVEWAHEVTRAKVRS